MKYKNLDFRNTILPDERCQIKTCPLTRDWENITHAIKPGCIKWKIKEKITNPYYPQGWRMMIGFLK